MIPDKLLKEKWYLHRYQTDCCLWKGFDIITFYTLIFFWYRWWYLFKNPFFYLVNSHFWAAAAAGASVSFHMESNRPGFDASPDYHPITFCSYFQYHTEEKWIGSRREKIQIKLLKKYWQNNDKIWLFLDAKMHSWVNSLDFYLYDKHFYRYGLKYSVPFDLYDKHFDRYEPIETARKVSLYESSRNYAKAHPGNKILLFHLPLFCCPLLIRSGFSDPLLPYSPHLFRLSPI